MPHLTVTVDITQDELANFIARLSGADGRHLKIDVAADEGAPSELIPPVVAAPVAAPAAPVSDKDDKGVLWNELYHSSSKNKNADGTWRRRKNMSDADKAAADAYESGGSPAPAPAPAPVAAPVLPAGLPVGLPGFPAAAPVEQPVSYDDVVALFQAAIVKDPGLPANFGALYTKVGISDPNALATDETLRMKLAKELRAIIG